MGTTKPLDGAHLVPIAAVGEGEAAVDGAPIEVHRAGAAAPAIADPLGAGEAQRVAEEIKEGGVPRRSGGDASAVQKKVHVRDLEDWGGDVQLL